MPARKRQPLKANEKWNSKKHANRRQNRPAFTGRFASGERVIGTEAPVPGTRFLGRLERPNATHHEGSVGVMADLRKRKYAYGKPKAK